MQSKTSLISGGMTIYLGETNTLARQMDEIAAGFFSTEDRRESNTSSVQYSPIVG